MWHQPCQCCKYTTSVDIKNMRYKKLVTHVEPHASEVSLLKRAENSAIQAIINHQSINQSINVEKLDHASYCLAGIRVRLVADRKCNVKKLDCASYMFIWNTAAKLPHALHLYSLGFSITSDPRLFCRYTEFYQLSSGRGYS